VSVLNSSWTPDFLAEMDSFPNGTHDDIVDSVSHGFGYLADQYHIGHVQNVLTHPDIVRYDNEIEKVLQEIRASGTPEELLQAEMILRGK
jgi:hypothetical protein